MIILNNVPRFRPDPESVIDMAKDLHSPFSEKLRPDQRKVMAKSLSQTVGRFLKAHPDIDGQTWKAKHLPYLDDWKAQKSVWPYLSVSKRLVLKPGVIRKAGV